MTLFDFDEKYVEELRETYHFPIYSMNKVSKERVLNQVYSVLDVKLGRHLYKRKWAKRLLFIILPVSLALLGFSWPKIFHGMIYPNGTEVTQGTGLTTVQMQHDQSNINGIGFPYAEFVRVHELGKVPANQIAYSKEEALKNPNTQEIILPYGIFRRMTPAQQKAEELKDPNWVQKQKLTAHDVLLIKEALAKHAAQSRTSSSK